MSLALFKTWLGYLYVL